MTITKSQNLDNLNLLIFTLRLDMLSEGYQEISTWLKLKDQETQEISLPLKSPTV